VGILIPRRMAVKNPVLSPEVRQLDPRRDHCRCGFFGQGKIEVTCYPMMRPASGEVR